MSFLKFLVFLGLVFLTICDIHPHSFEEEFLAPTLPTRQHKPCDTSLPAQQFSLEREGASSLQRFNRRITKASEPRFKPAILEEDLFAVGEFNLASRSNDARDQRTPSPPPQALLPMACPPFEKKDYFGLNELERRINDADTLKSITIIWDLHGVLTLDSDPRLNSSSVRPNIRVIELFLQAARKGALCIIASAWNNFEETLSEVRALGLGELAEIEESEQIHSGFLGYKTLPRVYYNRQGNIVSVRYTEGNMGNRRKAPDFLQKAFAPICLEHDKRQHDESVLDFWREETWLVEDSRRNIEQFALDREYCLREYQTDILGSGYKAVTYFLLPGSTTFQQDGRFSASNM